MKKKLLVILLTITLVLFSTTAFASSNPLTSNVNSILVDGIAIEETVPYQLYMGTDGTMMYPLRLITENLGAKISWDASTNSTLILNQKGAIRLNPQTGEVVINGVKIQHPYSVEFKNSRVYVSAEFIREIMGGRFQLDENNKTINLETPTVTLETWSLSASNEETKNALAAYLTSLELYRNFSGQVLVEVDGNILINRAYGYSDYENRIKAYNNTTFAIGSVTKQFTAAAIMQLAENNQLTYDDAVSKYLSNVPFGDEITIHQLLTHTSGLSNYTDLLVELLETGLSTVTFEGLMALIEDKPLDFEPGSNFNYSNTGYLILGEIVERISGQTLEAYLLENIFLPAGMENTSGAYTLDGKIVEANGYSGNMEVVQDTIDSILLNIAYGAGYLASTTQDLYRWNEALLSGEIISLKSLSRMFGKSPDMNLIAPYAYGWILHTGAFGEEVSHGGNTVGFSSLNTIFTERNSQIIILANKGYSDLTSIENNIISILNGDIVNPVDELTYVTVSEEQMNKYAGVYEIKDMLKIDIFVKDGKLMLQGENQPAIQLEAISETSFESSSFAISIEFNSTDQPTEFILYQSGLQFKAIRQE